MSLDESLRRVTSQVAECSLSRDLWRIPGYTKMVKGAMLMLSQWEVKNRNILKTDRDISLKFGINLLHGYTKPTLDKLFDSVQYSR